MMKVAFRVDSSTQMGSGHVMRCLTLANVLRESGNEIFFICRNLPGNLIGYLESSGFSVHCLPAPGNDVAFLPDTLHSAWLGVPWQTDAEEVKDLLKHLPPLDWLILDNYAIDSRWEKLVRPLVNRIMVIDDLADRLHSCDLLLDQNLYPQAKSRYKSLIPQDCRQLLGPSYALLRPEFVKERQQLRLRDGTVRRILIFFGGSDQNNETEKAVLALKNLNYPDIYVDVVVGNANPHKNRINRVCDLMPNFSFHCQINTMARLMTHADLAIGAGGSTTWERCCLALPSLVIAVADNQVKIAESCAAVGALEYLGTSSEVTCAELERILAVVVKDPVLLTKIAEVGSSLVDGNGAKRTAVSIEELT